MNADHVSERNPRIQAALNELKEMIQQKYPAATFEVSHGDDPEGVYLTPTVDVEDTEQVFNVVVNRLLEMQIEKELPVYVIPVRPLERVLREMRVRAQQRPYTRRTSILDVLDIDTSPAETHSP